jgi:hypothetical protein
LPPSPPLDVPEPPCAGLLGPGRCRRSRRSSRLATFAAAAAFANTNPFAIVTFGASRPIIPPAPPPPAPQFTPPPLPPPPDVDRALARTSTFEIR